MQFSTVLARMLGKKRGAALLQRLAENKQQRLEVMVTLDCHVDDLSSVVRQEPAAPPRKHTQLECPHCGSTLPADHPLLEPRVVSTVQTERHEPFLTQMRELMSRCKSALAGRLLLPEQLTLSSMARQSMALTTLELQCHLETLKDLAGKLVPQLEYEIQSLTFERQRLVELIAFGLSISSQAGQKSNALARTARNLAVCVVQKLCVSRRSTPRERGQLKASTSCIASVQAALSDWQNNVLPEIDGVCRVKVNIGVDFGSGVTA